jgi:hypothetical protein
LRSSMMPTSRRNRYRCRRRLFSVPVKRLNDIFSAGSSALHPAPTTALLVPRAHDHISAVEPGALLDHRRRRSVSPRGLSRRWSLRARKRPSPRSRANLGLITPRQPCCTAKGAKSSGDSAISQTRHDGSRLAIDSTFGVSRIQGRSSKEVIQATLEQALCAGGHPG